MKSKTYYTCSSCGYQSPKWLGKCPDCEDWNSFSETKNTEPSKREVKTGNVLPSSNMANQSVSFERMETKVSELDRVFGGGIVRGSIALLSGEPGIGKSTLTLQICDTLIKQKKQVLYISGEESTHQIADRGKRLGLAKDVALINTTNLEDIITTAREVQPDMLIIDSVQVMYSDSVSGVPGSVTQVRFVAEKFMELAKESGITVLLIGHVTKDGNLAGPRTLEHLVDVVLHLEGERYQNLRLLKTFKNRFGPTDEIGVFEMTRKGLIEVKNPTALFIEEGENKIGSVTTSIIEGSRPFFIEIQALVTYTKFGYPKRTVSGVDLNRLNIILAVLSKYANVNLDSFDVFVSTVGDFQTKDRGIDLAIAMAIVSSKLQKEISSGTLVLGEIGLTGSVRPVFQVEKRVKEAKKLGIKQIVVPNGKGDALKKVKSIEETIGILF